MEKFTNDAQTTLNGTITDSAVSLVVLSATAFPTSGNFRIRIGDEYIIVGGVSGATFSSLTRGAEGSVAVAHTSGATVSHVFTAGAAGVFAQGPSASISSELALFTGTTGKELVRATGTGLLRATSGVYGTPGNAVESELTFADNTTNDVSTTKHGLAPKAPNDTSKFLNGVGLYAIPLTRPEIRAALTPPVSSDFSWVNQGSSSVRDDTDSFVVIGAGTGSGSNLVLRVKSTPATPYVVTAFLLPLMLDKPFNGYGLAFRESSSGKLHLLDMLSIGGADPLLLRSTKYTTATAYSADYVSYNVPAPIRWLRIADNGTNRIVSISADGVDWLQIHSVGRTDFLTANQWGVVLSTENSGTPNFAPVLRVQSVLVA